MAKTKSNIRKAKPRGTMDRMPARTKPILPKVRKEKTLKQKMKDVFTSDEEKRKKAMRKQDFKKRTWV